MTRQEIADIHGVTKRTVDNWREQGCPSTISWKGKTKLVELDKREVDQWLQSQRNKEEARWRANL